MKKVWVLALALLLGFAAAEVRAEEWSGSMYTDSSLVGSSSGAGAGSYGSSDWYTGVYGALRFVGGFSRYTRDSVVVDLNGSRTGFQYGGALAAGYDFYPVYNAPFRTELELSFLGNTKLKEDTINANGRTYKASRVKGLQYFTMFVNGYWDIRLSSLFTPYVTLGLGLASVSSDAAFYGASDGSNLRFGSKTANNFAWNIGGGVSYSLTNAWNLDAGYRYTSMGSSDTNSQANAMGVTNLNRNHLSMHQLSLGVRYTF